MSNETVVSQQPEHVQTLCTQFTESYRKNRKLIASWGKTLAEIRDGMTVPKDLAESTDPQGATFTAICKELGIPRSTAYHYIDVFLITATYPQWLQDAAAEKNLNLALPHVQALFEDMRETIPANPDEFQTAGVVAKLKGAKKAEDDGEEGTSLEDLFNSFKAQLKKLEKMGVTIEGKVTMTHPSGWRADIQNGKLVGTSAAL